MGQNLLLPDVFPQKEIEDAIKKMSWKLLKKELDKFAWYKQPTKLLNTIIHSDSLIFKRINLARMEQRDSFFESIAGYFAKKIPSHSARLDDTLKWFHIFEECYADILSLEGQLDAVKSMRPVERIWAALEWYTRDYDQLTRKTESLLLEKSDNLVGSLSLAADNGGRIDPGTYHLQQAKALGAAIFMEAYRENWFDSEGYVVIPEELVADEEQVTQVGSIFMSANSWASVDELQQQIRFLGRGCQIRYSEEILDAPDGFKYVLDFDGPPESILFDHVTSERNAQRELADFLTFEFDPKLEKLLESLNQIFPNSDPKRAIHAASSLSALLNYNVTDDVAQYSGLTIEQWIAGYVAIRTVAISASLLLYPQAARKSVVLNFAEEELILGLTGAGLSEAEARRFIRNITFNRDSRDLFDSPLIRTSRGFTIVSDIVEFANIARAIASNILSRQGEFKLKGAALETKLRNVLSKKNLSVTAFKKKFSDGEYEFDAMLLWDRKLYIFECKNRWLSEGRPVAIANRMKMILEDVDQVKRLVLGLTRHPEIPELAFGMKVEFDEVIPCVVYGQPQALPKLIDGVCLTDISIVSRYFSSRYFTVDMHSMDDPHSTSVYDQWGAEHPSSESFERAINKPVQVLAAIKATQVSDVFIPVGTSILIKVGMLHMNPMSLEDYSAMLADL